MAGSPIGACYFQTTCVGGLSDSQCVQSLILSGIDCNAFIQFLQGRRNSVIIELEYPPFIGQNVVLQVDPACPPYPGPNVLNTNIKTIIANDSILASTRLYTITLIL